MLIISFGWTSPAFMAGEKDVTRRDWKPTHAAKFKKGTLAAAWDKDPRYGGKLIGVIRILKDVKYEAMADMPDSDYVAEGFAYLHKHPELVPASMPIDVSPKGFKAWRQSGGKKAVVRFEEVELVKCHVCGGKAKAPRCGLNGGADKCPHDIQHCDIDGDCDAIAREDCVHCEDGFMVVRK